MNPILPCCDWPTTGRFVYLYRSYPVRFIPLPLYAGFEK
jgi:hypothetical protein